MDNSSTTILVVDDEIEMRSMIVDYLQSIAGYKIIEAENGEVALELLEKNHVDLILSDINMPGMKGFDLLQIVRERFPSIKRVLITAYNVEEYLELAFTHDIGNIYVKTTPFNFDELNRMLSSLISKNIFGLTHYFDAEAEKIELPITSSKKFEQYASTIVSFIDEPTVSRKLELVIVEMLTNAIFYGIRNESPEHKETWNHDFQLPGERAVILSAAKDAEKFAVSINDCGGRLRKRDVLYWLHRQITQDADGLPLGLYDSHGRGLFITRKYIDRLIINIDPSHRTEIIIINYYNNMYIGYKPLYINEL